MQLTEPIRQFQGAGSDVGTRVVTAARAKAERTRNVSVPTWLGQLFLLMAIDGTGRSSVLFGPSLRVMVAAAWSAKARRAAARAAG
ncbi:hypothetical protein ACFXPA_31370 [Amycolatopsis sp. NPDC059090]|uniref:hypothetical protein n=1 Tax=Amycolatopsis sp. NPDC059090 TaxID=3346723 RepID=UPI0036714FCF